MMHVLFERKHESAAHEMRKRFQCDGKTNTESDHSDAAPIRYMGEAGPEAPLETTGAD